MHRSTAHLVSTTALADALLTMSLMPVRVAPWRVAPSLLLQLPRLADNCSGSVYCSGMPASCPCCSCQGPVLALASAGHSGDHADSRSCLAAFMPMRGAAFLAALGDGVHIGRQDQRLLQCRHGCPQLQLSEGPSHHDVESSCSAAHGPLDVNTLQTASALVRARRTAPGCTRRYKKLQVHRSTVREGAAPEVANLHCCTSDDAGSSSHREQGNHKGDARMSQCGCAVA